VLAVLIEPLSNLKEDSLSTVTVLIIRQFFNNDVTSPYISACIITPLTGEASVESNIKKHLDLF
jgi:hypothetical protein